LLNSKDIDEASKMMAKNISNQILKGLIANDKKTTEAFLDILPLLYKTTSLLTKDNIKRSFLNLKNKTEESIIEFFEKHYEKTEDIDIIDNITTKMSIAILAASLHQEKTKGSFSI
jgi:CMP-N-acetylneuraminic acid synthetase